MALYKNWLIATRTVEKIFRFQLGDWPSELSMNGARDTLYFINRHIYKVAVRAGQFPEPPFIPSKYDGQYNGGYYGLTVDEKTSEVYVADAIDYVQRGVVYRYSSRA